MAENNAKVTLENKEKQKNNILLELKDVLQMDKMPRKIETYDISNISGNFMVAAMCVLQDGEIKKNLSRRFKIKDVIGPGGKMINKIIDEEDLDLFMLLITDIV